MDGWVVQNGDGRSTIDPYEYEAPKTKVKRGVGRPRKEKRDVTELNRSLEEEEQQEPADEMEAPEGDEESLPQPTERQTNAFWQVVLQGNGPVELGPRKRRRKGD